MADRYWVGGTGNWSDDTNHWATSSGGLPGVGNKPTASDNAIFNTLSNALAYTVTINAAAVCLSLTFGAPLAGDVTWAGSSTLAISGSLTLYASLIRTYSGTITFNATSSKMITTAGVVTANKIIFNGIGGTWQMQDNWNNGSVFPTSNITLTAGTFDVNSKILTCASLDATTSSSTRALIIGGSTINCFQWQINDTGLTITGASTSTINLVSGGGNRFDITPNNNIYGTVTALFAAALTFSNVNAITPTNATFTTLSITSISFLGGLILTANVTVTGTLTLIGTNAAVQRCLIQSFNQGSVCTISAAVVSLTNVDFIDVTASGAAAPFTGTNIADGGRNSNITFTTPRTLYWVGNGGDWSDTTTHWAVTSGGAGGNQPPTLQDTAVFDANSFSMAAQSVTDTVVNRLAKDIDWSAVTNSPTFAMTGDTMFGSITLASGMTYTQTGAMVMQGAANAIITSNSLVHNFNYTIKSWGATVSLADNLVGSSSGTITINSGTFDANNKNLTLSLLTISNNSVIRVLNMGSGTWTFLGTGTKINVGATVTNFTLTPSSSVMKITDASGTGKNFTFNNLIFNNLWITGAGTGIYTFNDSVTLNDFKIDTPPHTITFTGGITVTVQTFTVAGTVGNLITLQSSNSTAWNIIKSIMGLISCDYLSISRSIATPAANVWYAGANSTNGGNNSGWSFTAAPYGIAVFDTITVSESVLIDYIVEINLFDSVTISENVIVELNLDIFIFDSVTISESASIEFSSDIFVFDSITVSESADTEYLLEISVSSAIMVSESLVMTIDLNPTVFDAITVTENVHSVRWAALANIVHLRDKTQNGVIPMEEVKPMQLFSREQTTPKGLDNDEIL